MVGGLEDDGFEAMISINLMTLEVNYRALPIKIKS